MAENRRFTSLAVMNIGFMYGNGHQITLGLNCHVPFPALDPLVPVKSSIRTHMVGCPDAT